MEANNCVCEMWGDDREKTPPDRVLEIVLENVLCFLTSRHDRNAASLVCKSWYRAEALTRSELFIGNCYAISPERVTKRFRMVKSLSLKGQPRSSDYNTLLPEDWGAYFSPWWDAMVNVYGGLEKLYLKRMTITDVDLALLDCFPVLKDIVLVCCQGFGTSGLAMVARDCRNIRVLDLIDCVEVTDDKKDWISCFPEDSTSLESLAFGCVEAPVNFEALERLVIRSPLLKKLGLNATISVRQVFRLIIQAPQLTHIGRGYLNSFEINPAYNAEQEPDDYPSAAFAACKALVSLSGLFPHSLVAMHPICANLTTLNFSYAHTHSEQLSSVICHCHRLKSLWVLDLVLDEGLQVVAATCKDLQELRVFPFIADPGDGEEDGPITEVGLLAIAEGCRKLQYILFYCYRMTNAALVTMSNNCPDLCVFRLCCVTLPRPDPITGEAMDEGFGAIVKNCKKLTRLAVSGLLTERAFSFIGQYGKLLRTLSVYLAGPGNSDLGLRYVLEGCPMLRKLEIMESPFGDLALLHSGLRHYYNMRSFWMSSCKVTHEACEQIARQLPGLVVEVINRKGAMGKTSEFVHTLYLYRSLEKPRADTPDFVSIL